MGATIAISSNIQLKSLRLSSKPHELLRYFSGGKIPMGQASVLTDSDIRRVFRVIKTTRHWQRNRLAFVFSIRIGEATLTVGDVITSDGEVRREIKLTADQTKESKGRTVFLSDRVRREIY